MTEPACTTIDEQILHLFAMVSEALAAATEAFLHVDRDAARILVAGDRRIDLLRASTEELVEHELAKGLVAGDDRLRLLVSALRIVPELERSGDLVEHIALRAPQGLAHDISPVARGLVAEMGHIAGEMWRDAAEAYAHRDPEAAGRLRVRDDEIDDLHVRLSTELAESATAVPVAIEMGLVARFYERLGDHAVNIAGRVRDLTDFPFAAASAS